MDLCAIYVLISCTWITGMVGQPLPVVSSDKFSDGGTINATCNYQRLTIAPEADFVMQLTLERKTRSDANFSSIAIYNPFLPRKQNVTNIPFRRNWTVTFTGGRNDVDSNVETIRIDLLIRDANCSDAGLYRCVAITNLNTVHESPLQNITAEAHLFEQPIIMIPDNKNSPYYSENEAGNNVTLTCVVYGPNDLTLTWKYRLEGPSKEATFSDTTGITESGPTLESSKGPCVTWRHESSLSFTLDVNAANMTYFCVVYSHATEITRENFTIGVQSDIENTTLLKPSAGPDAGAIAGGVIAAIIIVALAIVLIYFFWYRKRNQKETENDKSEEKTKKANTKVRFHIPSMFSTDTPKHEEKHDQEGKYKSHDIVKTENLYDSAVTRSQNRDRPSVTDQTKTNSLDNAVYSSQPIQENLSPRNRGYINEIYDNEDESYLKKKNNINERYKRSFDNNEEEEKTENVYDNSGGDSDVNNDNLETDKPQMYRREDREQRRRSRDFRSGRNLSTSTDNSASVAWSSDV